MVIYVKILENIQKKPIRTNEVSRVTGYNVSVKTNQLYFFIMTVND